MIFLTELSDKLLEKSKEAFIVGIELYNKPTIKYRVEGFSFFICNSWELMLKAHMIKTLGDNSIYYKDKPDRTLSLESCIKKIFTNDKDPLRINLEKIIQSIIYKKFTKQRLPVTEKFRRKEEHLKEALQHAKGKG